MTEKKLFNAVEIVFPQELYTNHKVNAQLRALGAPGHMIRENVNRATEVETHLAMAIAHYDNINFEREFARCEDEKVVWYLSFKSPNVPVSVMRKLAEMQQSGLTADFKVGRMMSNAQFIERKKP